MAERQGRPYLHQLGTDTGCAFVEVLPIVVCWPGQAFSTDAAGSAGEVTGTRDNPWWRRIALQRLAVPMGVKRVTGVLEPFQPWPHHLDLPHLPAC
jgi:hypothetical protein